MVFSNSVFLFLFLPISVLVYYFLFALKINIKICNIWLLIISFIFYAWGEPVYVFLMILSITVNYLLGRWVEKYAKTSKGKRIVAYACIYNLGQLFVFKYLPWIIGLIIGNKMQNTFLSRIVLPIGISFYTFQALSYVIDIYRGKDKAQKNILNTGLYISFFPQLIAGPIVRYSSIAKQLSDREHSWEKFSKGTWRFCIGLSKKILLANQLAFIADIAFNKDISELSVVMAWSGAFCFMLQLYYDFSGYSDMAIGLGEMFGFEFQENFNYPYISKSVTEYWRRWHISLGAWFRDYLYYPLTMGPAVKLRKRLGKKVSRKTGNVIASVFVLFVVWLATGIWHGANFTFVVWGLLQFAFIVWEQYRKPIKDTKLANIVGFTTTFLVVLLSKVIFKAENMSQGFAYYGAMLGLNGNSFVDQFSTYLVSQYKFFIIAGSIFIFPIVRWVKTKVENTNSKIFSTAFKSLELTAMTILLVADILYSVAGDYNPFLYFNF
ncbi:MAG: MBOAT family O-acyltransferase [Candidatus Limivicinus sp.]|jgi:alginate O-acetyltransferase complex protein AlgI